CSDWISRADAGYAALDGVMLDSSHAHRTTAAGNQGRIDRCPVAGAARVGDSGPAVPERPSRYRPGGLQAGGGERGPGCRVRRGQDSIFDGFWDACRDGRVEEAA